jgi:hypothetical protein
VRPAVAVGALALVLAGCGSGPVVVTGEPVAAPYDGPMSMPLDHSEEASVAARSGAAGRALECDGTPYNGGGADYDGGLESAQEDPESALEDLFSREGVSWGMPTKGYRIERRDDHRVLFSYDVAGRTRADFVVADGIEDWKHHTGWGVEAWAQCDPAELPAGFTDDLGIGVWSDATGARVPVTEVLSFQGAEHCDWQDITFLRLGEDPRGVHRDQVEEYLRDTHGELARSLTGSFGAHAELPGDARDTGWQRDGRELWLVPDRSAAYLVSLDDPSDVERWPSSKQQVGCA